MRSGLYRQVMPKPRIIQFWSQCQQCLLALFSPSFPAFATRQCVAPSQVECFYWASMKKNSIKLAACNRSLPAFVLSLTGRSP